METSAIIMMAISIIFLWGGLALAVLHLVRHPENLDD